MADEELRTIDLFSGCGGIALGLQRSCKVVAYCECDSSARKTIDWNMRRGHLDTAPVFEDVSTFPLDLAAVGGKPVDMVSMGFPCQDISMLGRRAGFAGKRSCLFFAGMRVVDHFQPTYVFLENVQRLTCMPEVWRRVMQSLHEHGYEARWGVLGAVDVGAPHRRKRWFCVARRLRGRRPTSGDDEAAAAPQPQIADFVETPWNDAPGYTFRADRDWEIDEPRLCAEAPHREMKQLGNICVPACAHAAFHILRHPVGSEEEARSTPFHPESLTHMPKWGRLDADGTLHRMRPPPCPVAADRKLILVPTDPSRIKKNKNRTARILDAPVHKRCWATPRTMSYFPCTLTRRTQQDLGTQLIHEQHTVHREGCRFTNPRYVEWMMGLPHGWTAASAASNDDDDEQKTPAATTAAE